MRRPVVITTPRPTVEETAKLLRIPRKDVEMVRSIVDEWANSPDTLSRFGVPPHLHNGNGKGKKPSARKRRSAENRHR